MGKKLEKLFDLIEEIETAMMTTRRTDGHLVSRAMATQKRAPGADLWFVTYEGAEKLREIENDPHVNLAYYKDRTREWVSISGTATVSRDRKKIRQLYDEDWRAWFSDEGDPRHGTPEDPRMVLVGVKIHSGYFLEINKPQPVVLYEVVKGILTNEFPKLGIVREVDRKQGKLRAKRTSADNGTTREKSGRGSASGSGARGTAKRGGAASRASAKGGAAKSGSRTAKPAAKRGGAASKGTSRRRSS